LEASPLRTIRGRPTLQACQERHSADRNRPRVRRVDQQEQEVRDTIEQEVPSAGPKRIIVNARGFDLDDAEHWIPVGLEITDAQEAR
jgi:hypothetical protein